MHEHSRGSSIRSAAGLRVALFAGLAADAGRREIDVPWPGGTVADLRAAVSTLVPGAAALLGRSAVVVAGRHAADAEVVPPGADVAFLPPVSGG